MGLLVLTGLWVNEWLLILPVHKMASLNFQMSPTLFHYYYDYCPVFPFQLIPAALT